MLYYRSLFNFFMTEVSIISYRNQSIDLQSKSMDRFLYDIDLRHERATNKTLRNPKMKS